MKDHTEYNESLYFNFHDEGNDLTTFMRIGPTRTRRVCSSSS